MCIKCILQGRALAADDSDQKGEHRSWYDCSYTGLSLKRPFGLPPQQTIPEDEHATRYLRPLLELLPDELRAIEVDGDGHCLVHAISRHLIGVEMAYEVLRLDLQHELTIHIDFYLGLFEVYGIDRQELMDLAADAAPNDQPELDEGIFQQLGKSLAPMHVFALANVLRRPIVLFSAPADFGKSNAGVYLPTRVGPTKGPDGCLLPPVLVSWSSGDFGHFVSLIPVHDQEATGESMEGKRLVIDPAALPRADGELMVFGPYEEADCEDYLENREWAVCGRAMPGGAVKGLKAEQARLESLWRAQNPTKDWEVECMVGMLRAQEQNRIMNYLHNQRDGHDHGGAFLPPVEPSVDAENAAIKAREAAQRRKAEDRAVSTGAANAMGVVYTEPFMKYQSGGELSDAATAMLNAIFDRHAIQSASGKEALDAKGVQAWLHVAQGRCTAAEAESFLARFGTDAASITRDDFLRYYAESAEKVPHQVWTEMVNHDFGYDMRPMDPIAEEHWKEPKLVEKEEPGVIWEIKENFPYGWTAMQAEMSRTIEQGYQQFLAGTAAVIALKMQTTTMILRFETMTLSNTKLVYKEDGSLYRVEDESTRADIRRRVNGAEPEELPPELPSNVADLLKSVTANMSAEDRQSLVKGFSYAAEQDGYPNEVGRQDPPAVATEARPDLVVSLTGMGFSEAHAVQACLATGNSTVDAALEWLFEHPQEEQQQEENPPPAPVETDEEYDARLKEAGKAHVACLRDKDRRGTPEHAAIKATYEAIKAEGRPSTRRNLSAQAQALARLAGVVPQQQPAAGIQERLRSWQAAVQAHSSRVAVTPSVLEKVPSWSQEPADLMEELVRSHSDHHRQARSRNRANAGVGSGEDGEDELSRTASLPITKGELSLRVRTDWSAAWRRPVRASGE